MPKFTCRHKSINCDRRAFTLIEVMVVVSIIVILSSIGMSVYANARKDARDQQRVSDIEQIKLALKLYRETNGSYPAGSMVIDDTTSILNDFLADFQGDPINEGGFEYRYEPSYGCGAEVYVAVLANKMENSAYSNHGEVCGVENESYISIVAKDVSPLRP